MITAAPISHITADQIHALGQNGYTSDQYYHITSNSKLDGVSFLLQLTSLDTSYVKSWQTTAEDITGYNELMKEGHSFGAFNAAQLLGFIVCEERKWNNTLYITSLLVAEKQRSKGIGRLLLSKVIDHAVARRFRLLELETQNTNAPAIRFYKKMGFTITGLNLHLYDPVENNNEVAIFMSCDISDRSTRNL